MPEIEGGGVPKGFIVVTRGSDLTPIHLKASCIEAVTSTKGMTRIITLSDGSTHYTVTESVRQVLALIAAALSPSVAGSGVTRLEISDQEFNTAVSSLERLRGNPHPHNREGFVRDVEAVLSKVARGGALRG